MTGGLDWKEGEEKALDLFLTGNYAELILKEQTTTSTRGRLMNIVLQFHIFWLFA